jgi:hypothetical protein
MPGFRAVRDDLHFAARAPLRIEMTNSLSFSDLATR